MIIPFLTTQPIKQYKANHKVIIYKQNQNKNQIQSFVKGKLHNNRPISNTNLIIFGWN